MKLKFKIHPFTYLFSLICVFTGNFKIFLIFTSIILFHEFGHIFGCIITKNKIDNIILLPFGGITILKYPLNIKLKDEFLIVIMGPLFQLVLYLILKDYNLYYFKEINLFLTIFNTLPIIPLDGYRILNILLNKIFSFKLSLYISSYISFISLILLILFYIMYNNFIFLIVLSFLIYKTVSEFKLINYIYNKFLYERYNDHIVFKKHKKINNIKNMYRDYIHLIYYNYRFYSEKEMLEKVFNYR